MVDIKYFNEAQLTTAYGKLKGGNYTLLNAARTDDFSKKRVVAFGIPFTVGMFLNEGTFKAANAVREQSVLYACGMYPHDSHYELDQIADGGNLSPEDEAASAEQCLLNIREQIKVKMGQGNFRTVFVGGDHTIPYATIGAVSEHLGESLAVIHIDAHPDIGNMPTINDGTFMYDLSKSGHIAPEHSFQLYLRHDFFTEEDNSDVVNKINIIDTFEMKSNFRKDGFKSLIKQVKKSVGEKPVYITFDMDAFDAAYAPGTTYPMHYGATSEEMATLFLEMSKSGINFVGGEIVELIPDLDTPTKTTCSLATVVLRDITNLIY